MTICKLIIYYNQSTNFNQLYSRAIFFGNNLNELEDWNYINPTSFPEQFLKIALKPHDFAGDFYLI